jgi:hypothetical protein
LKKCELYEINEVFICNLKDLYAQIEIDKYAAEQEIIEFSERNEYERLKAKFENNK